MLREGLRADGRMQLLRSSERCTQEIDAFANSWGRNMKQNAANSGIIDQPKKWSVLVKLVVEEFPQLWHLSRKDSVSGIENTV
jgi:hypothetical protein